MKEQLYFYKSPPRLTWVKILNSELIDAGEMLTSFEVMYDLQT